MKTKKPLIAIIMLALAAFTAHADEKVDALVKAAGNNNAAEVRRLIADGADVNAKDYYGMTALMFAAWSNSADVAEILLAAGADLNAKDNRGRTALMIADDFKATNIAELLKAAGAE